LEELDSGLEILPEQYAVYQYIEQQGNDYLKKESHYEFRNNTV